MQNPDQPCELLNRTLALYEAYRDNGGTPLTIALETGLSYHWLNTLHRTKNPSVNRIVCLYEHLSGKKLTLGE